MIEVNNLSKLFGEKKALDKITLKIPEGSIVGLIGPNGAGKSTLLRILAGVYQKSEGIISIDGKSPYDNVEVKKNMFYIADTPQFFSNATLKIMAHYYSKLYLEHWDEQRYKHIISTFTLNSDKKISKLSLGSRNLSALALAFSANPKYLLMDEILNGIDPVMQKIVNDLIIELVSRINSTIIISSHNLREIAEICDYICFLHNGNLVLAQGLDELKQNYFRIKIIFSNNEGFKNFEKEFDLSESVFDGKVAQFSIHGEEAYLNSKIIKTNPLYYELLPMTLNEIFIYKMEEMGYEHTSFFE